MTSSSKEKDLERLASVEREIRGRIKKDPENDLALVALGDAIRNRWIFEKVAGGGAGNL